MRKPGGISRAGRRARIVPALLAVTLLSGCWHESEAALRDRLERWFALGETVAFHASKDCLAGAFRLVQMQMKAAVPVVGAAPDAPRELARRGAVAVDNPQQAPDAAMVEIVNTDRAVGMGMRRAALEGRMCMNDYTESAFRYALDNPRAVLIYDTDPATLMLLDPGTGLLIVAKGAAEWL